MCFATPSLTTPTIYSATQALFSNTLPQRLSTTLFSNISAQHSPPTLLCSVSLQLLHNTLLQYTLLPFQHSQQNFPQKKSTTLFSNAFYNTLCNDAFITSLQHSSPTLQQYPSPTLLYNTPLSQQPSANISTTLFSNKPLLHTLAPFLQDCPTTLLSNASLQHSSPTLCLQLRTKQNTSTSKYKTS